MSTTVVELEDEESDEDSDQPEVSYCTLYYKFIQICDQSEKLKGNSFGFRLQKYCLQLQPISEVIIFIAYGVEQAMITKTIWKAHVQEIQERSTRNTVNVTYKTIFIQNIIKYSPSQFLFQYLLTDIMVVRVT